MKKRIVLSFLFTSAIIPITPEELYLHARKALAGTQFDGSTPNHHEQECQLACSSHRFDSNQRQWKTPWEIAGALMDKG